MSKSSHFFGQPVYCQVIKLLDKAEILEISRKNSGERYIKRFDAWTHLVTMLYAVIMRHDSLREISVSLLAEARKLSHLGISTMPTRSTLSDANARRPEKIFESIYGQLYGRYRQELISDSRGRLAEKWMKRLQIIDSTTISLFSNLLFKGVGRNPKTGKKKVTMFASDSLTWRSTGAVGPLAAKASPERSEEKKIDVKAIACKFVKAKTFTAKPIRLWNKVTKKISADKISPSASMSI